MKTQAIAPGTTIETSAPNQQPNGETQMNRISSLLVETRQHRTKSRAVGYRCGRLVGRITDGFCAAVLVFVAQPSICNPGIFGGQWRRNPTGNLSY